MTEIFGVSTQALLSQLLIGLVNGSFYAMLSLGLAVIFGLLNIINFAHGALYMMGAFGAWMGLNYLGLNYWACSCSFRSRSGCSASSSSGPCCDGCTSSITCTGSC